MQGTEEEPLDPHRPIGEDAHDDALAQAAPAQTALGLDEEERLPWLESADDEDEDGGVDTARLVRFVLLGVALLAAIVGGLWFVSHQGGNQSRIADGGVIKAPAVPYKEAPKDAGGKTFAGTGDSAFAVSEGKSTPAKLGGAETPVAAATSGAAAAGGADTGGVGVQVGAYSSQAAAEAGWSRLASGNETLKSLRHRILEGSADIGTVYRLQAVAGDLAAANALCASLKASGVACQVKH